MQEGQEVTTRRGYVAKNWEDGQGYRVKGWNLVVEGVGNSG